MKIRAFSGSIVDPSIGAHAVVNASNPSVGLGSGVSGAIREACGGPAFQNEVRERLEEEFGESLESGDCLVTTAGTCAAFRWVLHVAAVDYRRPDPQTGGPSGPRRIRTCFQGALREAVALADAGSFVLAAPLLGAGHGGLGAVAALDAMMGGLRDHLDTCPAEDRPAIGQLVFAVPNSSEARLVPLAAARHGFLVSE